MVISEIIDDILISYNYDEIDLESARGLILDLIIDIKKQDALHLKEEETHSQESPSVEKSVEGGDRTSGTKETTNGVSGDNTSTPHPDTIETHSPPETSTLPELDVSSQREDTSSKGCGKLIVLERSQSRTENGVCGIYGDYCDECQECHKSETEDKR